VAALALDGDDVLAEVVSEADHGQRLARGHHSPILAMAWWGRPPSSGAPQTLYRLPLLGSWRPYVDEAAQEGHHAGNDSAYDGEPYAYVGTDVVDLTALGFVKMIGVDRN
jgi:hypothetical protein